MISAKNTNAEATKLVVESISNNRGLNTLTIIDKYESSQLSPSYLVDTSSSLAPMTGVPDPEAGVLDGLLDHLLDPRGEFGVSASLSDPQGTARCSLQSADQNCYSW